MKTFPRRISVPVILIGCVVFMGIGAGCERGEKESIRNRSAEAMKNIDDVIRVYSDSLMAIPGVVGLYHGEDEEGRTCLKVMVKERTPELERRLPKRIEGYPVVIEETGEIRPM
jgi:hypothetical protein